MVELFGVDTDIWTAVAASAQTLLIGAAAVVAYRQVREARRTREDQTRPFVIMDFDMTEPPLIYLVISNIGKTVARRVRIQTDLPLASSLDRDDELGPIAKLRVFTEEISSLVPGRQIRLLFDSFVQRDRATFDDSYRVTITYEGERRRSWWRDRARSYVEDSSLDLGIYWNLQYIERHTIHDVHEQVKRIAEAVRSWGAGVGSGSGILVVSPEDKRKARALARRRFRARPESSFAPREASMGPAQWALRRLRERASRVLATVSERINPEER